MKTIWEAGPLAEIFIHEDQEGVVRGFNVTAITQKIVRGKHAMCKMPVDKPLHDFMMANGGVEESHVMVAMKNLHKPIIVLHFKDDTCIVVDGNHRVVARHRAGLDHVNAFMLYPDDWEDCLVDVSHVPSRMYRAESPILPPTGHVAEFF